MKVKSRKQAKEDFYNLLRKYGVASVYVINYYNHFHYNNPSLSRFLKERDPARWVDAPFVWDIVIWYKIDDEWNAYLKETEIIN